MEFLKELKKDGCFIGLKPVLIAVFIPQFIRLPKTLKCC